MFVGCNFVAGEADVSFVVIRDEEKTNDVWLRTEV
jgi:hypothetical protein